MHHIVSECHGVQIAMQKIKWSLSVLVKMKSENVASSRRTCTERLSLFWFVRVKMAANLPLLLKVAAGQRTESKHLTLLSGML